MTTKTLTGTWTADTTHSTVDFAVTYMKVARFSAPIQGIEATLDLSDDLARLNGKVLASNVQIADENLRAHLLSPEFFDAENHPEITFSSDKLSISGSEVLGEGQLTIKGVSHPVQIQGKITDPITDPWGNERIGLDLHATVDRTAFGINWNTPLPSGEQALANDVDVHVQIQAVTQ